MIIILVTYTFMRESSVTRFAFVSYLKVCLTFYQVLQILQLNKVSWPRYIRQVIDFHVIAFEWMTQVPSLDCLQVNVIDLPPFYVKAVISIASPLVFTVLTWILFSLRRKYCCFQGRQEESDQVLKVSAQVTFFILLPSYMISFMETFTCSDVDGVQRLYTDLERECFSEEHTFFIRVVIIPTMVLYLAVLPIWLVCDLKRKINGISRASLDFEKMFVKIQDSPEKPGEKPGENLLDSQELLVALKTRVKLRKALLHRYGFLTAGLKQHVYYWELLVVAMKILLVLCVIFVMPIDYGLQVYLSAVVLSAEIFATIIVRPYKSRSLTFMVLVSRASEIIVTFIGLFFMADPAEEYNRNEGFVTTMFGLIFASQVAFLLYFLLNLRRECMKAAIESNREGCYKLLSCCCQKDKEDFLLEFHRFENKKHPLVFSRSGKSS